MTLTLPFQTPPLSAALTPASIVQWLRLAGPWLRGCLPRKLPPLLVPLQTAPAAPPVVIKRIQIMEAAALQHTDRENRAQQKHAGVGEHKVQQIAEQGAVHIFICDNKLCILHTWHMQDGSLVLAGTWHMRDGTGRAFTGIHLDMLASAAAKCPTKEGHWARPQPPRTTTSRQPAQPVNVGRLACWQKRHSEPSSSTVCWLLCGTHILYFCNQRVRTAGQRQLTGLAAAQAWWLQMPLATLSDQEQQCMGSGTSMRGNSWGRTGTDVRTVRRPAGASTGEACHPRKEQQATSCPTLRTR